MLFLRSQKTLLVFTGFLFLLLISTMAYAVPIGVFSWDEHSQEDCDFFTLCGPVFSVGNKSHEADSLGPPGQSFFDVFVELDIIAHGRQQFRIVDALGENIVAPGDSGQSSDDLSIIVIASAGLGFSFGDPSLSGSIRLVDAEGNILPFLASVGSSALIDFVPPVEPVSVPEPSTLFLFGSGLAGVALWRQFRRRT